MSRLQVPFISANRLARPSTQGLFRHGEFAPQAIGVSVSCNPAGQVQLGVGDGLTTRYQVHRMWYERHFEFRCFKAEAGETVLAVTIPWGLSKWR
jgi:hypothetical protein